MEFDKDKLFGYPVLRPIFSGENAETMDYIRANFEMLLETAIDPATPETLTVNFQIDYSVPEFNEYIANNQIGIFLDFRCKRTFFSQRFEVERIGSIDLDLGKLRDLVSVSPFIIAKQDFHLKSRLIHSDYGREGFHAKAHSVIAWCPPTHFSVEKELYKSVRSIIEFAVIEIPFGEYLIDLEQDYIFVHASEDFIRHCKNAEATPQTQLAIIGSFYAFLLSEVFTNMATRAGELDEFRWFNVIQTKCDELGLECMNMSKAHDNAQAILKFPLKEIARGGFTFHA